MNPFAELRRRNVFRVAAAYIVTAWLVIQVVETILPAFGFGDSAVRYVTIAFAVGLIPVLVLSWVFEWTPEGIRREAGVDDGAPSALRAAGRFDRMILVVLALALGYFAFDKFVVEPQRQAEEAIQQQVEVAEAREVGRSEALVESYGDKSIAVLPFRDMSPEGDQAYFSEGIAEELLNLLARESRLRVISRTSSFAFKDQVLEVPEIAKRLKVGHVLEGSVRKAGNTVRITAQLIEARSDTHLWSQTWDRELTDILAIQDEIAAAVAESLHTVLLGPVGSAAAQELTEAELEAYELVLKGRYLLNQGNAEAYRRAVPLYERAIEAAPDYAPGYSGLAKALRQMIAFGTLEPELATPRVEAALDRALELDPEDSDALATRGAILGLNFLEPDIRAAQDYWERAIAINPNDGDSLRWLGWSYRNVDSVRYLDYMERAYRVAPTNALVSTWLAYALNRFDRIDEALGVLRDWRALDPESTLPFSAAGDIYYQAQQLDKAVKSYFRAFRIEPDRALDEIHGLVWLFLDGLSSSPENLALALRWAEQCIATDPDCVPGYFQKAVLLSISGDQEEASRLADEMAARAPDLWSLHARLQLLINRNFHRSREWWEVGEMSSKGLDMWDTFRIMDYAFVLGQTGDPDRAGELIDLSLARIEEQMAAGVKIQDWWELSFYAAGLHALRGENQRALNYLRQDAENRGLSSLAALKTWPHFDGLRDDPEFQALIAEQEVANARWSQRLDNEGLLLTPEEVLALKDFDFDPFAEPASDP